MQINPFTPKKIMLKAKPAYSVDSKLNTLCTIDIRETWNDLATRFNDLYKFLDKAFSITYTRDFKHYLFQGVAYLRNGDEYNKDVGRRIAFKKARRTASRYIQQHLESLFLNVDNLSCELATLCNYERTRIDKITNDVRTLTAYKNKPNSPKNKLKYTPTIYVYCSPNQLSNAIAPHEFVLNYTECIDNIKSGRTFCTNQMIMIEEFKNMWGYEMIVVYDDNLSFYVTEDNVTAEIKNENGEVTTLSFDLDEKKENDSRSLYQIIIDVVWRFR